mmetsp:Transcript_3500/g.8820  ORF Transcript_3500/g.8820 Transcript_3500/m.8820 type:complete len:273 (+) Transcript_3500:62-880(+)
MSAAQVRQSAQAIQDATLSSVFVTKDKMPKHRFDKLTSSSCVGRGGASVTRAVFAQEHSTSRALVFRKRVDQCLEAKDLDGVYQTFRQWDQRCLGEVPYDNRELNEVKRKATRIVRDMLCRAVRGEDLDEIREALRVAGVAADKFPQASQVKASLEYKAALHREEELLTQQDEETPPKDTLLKELPAASREQPTVQRKVQEEESTMAGSDAAKDVIEDVAEEANEENQDNEENEEDEVDGADAEDAEEEEAEGEGEEEEEGEGEAFDDEDAF